MPDKPNDSSEKTQEPTARKIHALPGESFHGYLKRISQMPRGEGESIFVEGGPPIGPMTVMSLPEIHDEDTPEIAEEHFRIEMERRRRQSLGLPSGPVTEEHFSCDPKADDSDPTKI